MEIPKHFDPGEIADKWYRYWQEQGYFRSVPDDRTPYTVVIPPPNVTGVLHMGHMLNNTIQDVLVRKKRMEGYNACWVPGTDHASIATEAKVVQKLAEEGVHKEDIGREEFLKHAWEWTHEHGGTILQQLKRLGASCDWERTAFTMDDDYYQSVIDVFVDLYRKGKIYRGVRMVNWDPVALTALSDEEVFYREVNSKLYHVRYPLLDGEGRELTIATTRPETILGDTGICVHPEDERYQELIGERVRVPLIDRKVPIVADEHVDPEFGTGCLKITPAHDENDQAIGERHGLETVEILNDDASLNEQAGRFQGQDRNEARENVAKALKDEGLLVKVEDIVNKVGYSERTDAVIEPKLSLQWFCSMEKLSEPALESVMNDEVRFVPEKFKNTYRHWMENIKDWCISRQLWWGHRIPAWFYGNTPDEFVVARSEEEALQKAQDLSGDGGLKMEDLHQDEDVLDTWFSSWLWPIAVFNGIQEPDNEELNYYYPTDDLVTAPEIMFFWIARMIMAGYEYRGEKPFSNVYYTGIVRDRVGRKMSKSLGNSPDPIELIDNYGADGVRVGMLLCSPAGNDLLFNTELCQQGRNFGNKLWNALRLIKNWQVEEREPNACEKVAVDWFHAELNATIEKVEEHFDRFRISDALMSTYRLSWERFCSWYLEAVKPVKGEAICRETFERSIAFFEQLLKLVHPFMPFVTEELWHLVTERRKDEAITVAEWPLAKTYDETLIERMKSAQEVVMGVRTIRQDNGISEHTPLSMSVLENKDRPSAFDPMVRKLANLERIDRTNSRMEGTFSFLVGSDEYFIPFEGGTDPEEEREELQQELERMQGFLEKSEKKLSNERFVENASEEVVKKERQKKADAEAKIEVLKEKLEALQARS